MTDGTFFQNRTRMAMVSAIDPDSSSRVLLAIGDTQFTERDILRRMTNRPDYHQGAGHCHALSGPEPLRV